MMKKVLLIETTLVSAFIAAFFFYRFYVKE